MPSDPITHDDPPTRTSAPDSEPSTDENHTGLAAASGSVLGQLRTQYAQSLAARTTILQLPIIENLWARFSPIGARDLERARKQRLVSMNDNIKVCADAITLHCEEILFGETADELEPLHSVIERETGSALSGPIRFDARLAQIFDLKVDSPRQVVLGLLTRPDDDMPFLNFFDELARWSQGAAGRAVEDAVGE